MLDLSIVMILDNMDLKINSMEEKRDDVITTNTSFQTVETKIINRGGSFHIGGVALAIPKKKIFN